MKRLKFLVVIIICANCASKDGSKKSNECKEDHNEFRLRMVLSNPSMANEMNLFVNRQRMIKLLHFPNDYRTDSMLTAFNERIFSIVSNDLSVIQERFTQYGETLKACDIRFTELRIGKNENSIVTLNQPSPSSKANGNKPSLSYDYSSISRSKNAIFDVRGNEITITNIYLINDTIFLTPWSRLF